MAPEVSEIEIPGTHTRVPRRTLLLAVGVLVVLVLVYLQRGQKKAPDRTLADDLSLSQVPASVASAVPADMPAASTATPLRQPGRTTNQLASIADLQRRLNELNHILEDPDLHRPGNEGFLAVWTRRRDGVRDALNRLMAGQNSPAAPVKGLLPL